MSPLPHKYLVCRDVSGVVEYMQISDDEIGFCQLRSEGTLFSAEGATNLVKTFNLLAPPEGGRGAWRAEPAAIRVPESYFPSPYHPHEKGADERRTRDTAADEAEDTMVTAVRQAVVDDLRRERDVSKAIAARFGPGADADRLSADSMARILKDIYGVRSGEDQ